jgi:hyaluronan synthase
MADFRLFFVLCLILLLIVPIVLQYIYGWGVFFSVESKSYNISVYGFYLLSYMLIQFVFAAINKTKWVKMAGDTRRSARIVSKVNVMVVGHKEDPDYFRMCLDSLVTAYPSIINLNKIYIIIDGNDEDDRYMVDTFFEVFEDRNVRHIDIDEIRITDEVLTLHMSDVNDVDIVCISQRHGGKRSAMMTGFKMTLLENLLYKRGVDTIFCSDSDTVITPECVVNMFGFFSDDKIGAVAGNLGIYNKYDSVVSFMSSVRYWFAFNLERAYQSMTGSVLCVSGPIGMYRTSYLEMILDEWSEQQFLGKLCTYGDDRHLTNKILGLEKKVIYVPSSYAETETPSSWYRFFKQQTRWNKSAFREFFWTLAILDKHSLFMTVDLVYVLLYPYVVMGYLLYILWYQSTFELGFYSAIVLLLGLIKSIYGSISSGKYENMFYFLYIFMYITTVFPAKIWALININDNSWGTSSRKIMQTNVSIDIVVPILWNVVLIGGFVYNIYKSVKSGFVIWDFLLLIVVFGFWCLCFVVMWMYVYTKKGVRVIDSKVQ